MKLSYPIDVSSMSPFTIDNLPYGIFSTAEDATRRAGAAIGDYVIDLAQLEASGCFTDDGGTPKTNGHSATHSFLFDGSTLNAFAAAPATERAAIRQKIITLLEDVNSIIFKDEHVAYPLSEVKMHLPMQIGDFTDFMCSLTHVNNCSKMAGAPGPPPNFYAMPTAYNGRSSSVVISGTPIHRPRGITSMPGSKPPQYSFAPSTRMDYELEMGIFICKPVPFGKIINTVEEAKEHVFGLVMLNDWSARDIQFSEMTPLGPFNGKGSGTTISPWIVPFEAIESSFVSSSDALALEKMSGLPTHLRHENEKQTWDVEVEVQIKRGEKVMITSRSNLKDLYWSPLQMIAHHASSGCGLRTGDLIGTGTISSPAMNVASGDVPTMGCLHEINKAGSQAFTVQGREVMWIEDNDEVCLSGKIQLSGGKTIGFGDCKGVLLPSIE